MPAPNAAIATARMKRFVSGLRGGASPRGATRTRPGRVRRRRTASSAIPKTPAIPNTIAYTSRPIEPSPACTTSATGKRSIAPSPWVIPITRGATNRRSRSGRIAPYHASRLAPPMAEAAPAMLITAAIAAIAAIVGMRCSS